MVLVRMALRVLLLPRRCSWRCGESQLRGLLQARGARQSASHNAQDDAEWTLDLDVGPDEASHAPHEEPHPKHSSGPAPAPYTTAAHGNRLLFSVGKKLMTAEEFTRKVTQTGHHRSSLLGAQSTADFEADENEDFDLEGDVDLVDIGEEKWWGRVGGEGKEDGEEEVGKLFTSEDVRSGDVRSEGDANNKGRGFHSLREMRKFLRGRGLAGSRVATPPTETAELLLCLQRNLKPNAKHLEVFSTVPSVLGSSVATVQTQIDHLKKLGFSRHDIETVLLAFSSVLEVDYANVYAVCTVLKRCIAGGYMLRGLLMRHPFLFLQPPEQIEARAIALREICRDPNALGSLFHNFPILLLTPLTPSTLQTITKYTGSHHHTVTEVAEAQAAGLGHSWVAKSLYHNLSALPARLEPGPDVLSLTALLADFQLDPSPILVKFPGFFKASYDHVVSLLDVLTGSPLYLDTDSIRTLLCSIPDQLVWNEDPECLRSHLMTLASLFRSVKECMEKVVLYPGLVLPQLDLHGWVRELGDLGFTKEHIAVLVSGTPNVLLQDREKEFMPRLKFLLGVPETSPSDIVACSVGIRIQVFSTPLDVLNVRLDYALKHVPDMVCGQQLTKIFASQSKDFAALCGRSAEQLRSDTGLTGIELKRFKSRRKMGRKAAVGSDAFEPPPQKTVSLADSTNNDDAKAKSVKYTKLANQATKKKKTGQKPRREQKDVPKSSPTPDAGSPRRSPVGSQRSPSDVGTKQSARGTKGTNGNKVSKVKDSPEADADTGSLSSSSATAYGASGNQQTPGKTFKTSTARGKKSYAKKHHEQAQTGQTC